MLYVKSKSSKSKLRAENSRTRPKNNKAVRDQLERGLNESHRNAVTVARGRCRRGGTGRSPTHPRHPKAAALSPMEQMPPDSMGCEHKGESPDLTRARCVVLWCSDATDQLEQKVVDFFVNAKKNKTEWREEQMEVIKKVRCVRQ